MELPEIPDFTQIPACVFNFTQMFLSLYSFEDATEHTGFCVKS